MFANHAELGLHPSGPTSSGERPVAPGGSGAAAGLCGERPQTPLHRSGQRRGSRDTAHRLSPPHGAGTEPIGEPRHTARRGCAAPGRGAGSPLPSGGTWAVLCGSPRGCGKFGDGFVVFFNFSFFFFFPFFFSFFLYYYFTDYSQPGTHRALGTAGSGAARPRSPGPLGPGDGEVENSPGLARAV